MTKTAVRPAVVREVCPCCLKFDAVATAVVKSGFDHGTEETRRCNSCARQGLFYRAYLGLIYDDGRPLPEVRDTPLDGSNGPSYQSPKYDPAPSTPDLPRIPQRALPRGSTE